MRTHINYGLSTLPSFFILFSLFAPIALDECHAWFHLYGFRRAARNGKGAKYSKWEYLSPAGFTTATFLVVWMLTQRLRMLGHTESDIVLHFKLLLYYDSWQINKINTCDNTCIKLTVDRDVWDCQITSAFLIFMQYSFIKSFRRFSCYVKFMLLLKKGSIEYASIALLHMNEKTDISTRIELVGETLQGGLPSN